MISGGIFGGGEDKVAPAAPKLEGLDLGTPELKLGLSSDMFDPAKQIDGQALVNGLMNFSLGKLIGGGIIQLGQSLIQVWLASLQFTMATTLNDRRALAAENISDDQVMIAKDAGERMENIEGTRSKTVIALAGEREAGATERHALTLDSKERLAALNLASAEKAFEWDTRRNYPHGQPSYVL